MGVLIIRAPIADIDVMGPGAVFFQRLAAITGDDFQLYPGQCHRCLHGLRNRCDIRGVAGIHGDGEAVGQSGSGQQLLRLGDIKVIGVAVQFPEETLGQESLVHIHLAFDDGVGNRLIIHQPFHRFAHFGLGQKLVFLVHRHVEDRAFDAGLNLDIRVGRQGGDLFGQQIARHVDITGFEHQALGCRFRHMAVDCAGKHRFVAGIILIPLQHHSLVGAPFLDDVGAGTGIVGFQPVVAIVAIHFVGGHQILVDHHRHRGGQAIQQEGRGIGLIHGEIKAVVAGLLDHGFDIVGGQAELAKDEGGRLVQLDGADDGIDHIIRHHVVARGEFLALFHGERHGLAIGRHRPGVSHHAKQL